MSDFLELMRFSFDMVNLPFTVLLLVVMLYWGCVIAGAMDLDFFDIDADADVDMDADVDVDGVEGGGFFAFLRFFNVGEVPLMIVASVFVIVLWAGAITFNYQLNSSRSIVFSWLYWVPGVIAAGFVAKLLTMPLRRFFRMLASQTEDHEDLVGKVCTVVTSEVTEKFGQVEMDNEGAPVRLNARTRDGEVLARGDRALLLEERAGQVCLVTAFKV